MTETQEAINNKHTTPHPTPLWVACTWVPPLLSLLSHGCFAIVMMMMMMMMVMMVMVLMMVVVVVVLMVMVMVMV